MIRTLLTVDAEQNPRQLGGGLGLISTASVPLRNPTALRVVIWWYSSNSQATGGRPKPADKLSGVCNSLRRTCCIMHAWQDRRTLGVLQDCEEWMTMAPFDELQLSVD